MPLVNGAPIPFDEAQVSTLRVGLARPRGSNHDYRCQGSDHDRSRTVPTGLCVDSIRASLNDGPGRGNSFRLFCVRARQV